MGFRAGAYATVWNIEPVSNVNTKGRISISRKNKQSGEYETDFSGYVNFLGTSAASRALNLREKDRIKLKDVDVKNVYVKEKNATYYNCHIFDFETQDEAGTQTPPPSVDSFMSIPDSDGEVEVELPF